MDVVTGYQEGKLYLTAKVTQIFALGQYLKWNTNKVYHAHPLSSDSLVG